MNFDIERSLGFILSKTNMKLKNELFKRFNSYDITPEQWSVLNFLQIKKGATPKELSDLICKDKPNTNHILEKLQLKELIVRKPHPDDKRSYLIYLTERGSTLRDELIPIAVQLLDEATQGIDKSKTDELLTLLKLIFDNLD